MREIKFRVWDFQNNNWASEAESVMSMGLKFSTNDFYFGENKEKLLRFHFLQFTGLTDKNGVEVFEGDVLKNPQVKIGEVVFNEGKFCIKTYRKNDTIWYMPLDIGFMKNKEIIGNIYSNPELLK